MRYCDIRRAGCNWSGSSLQRYHGASRRKKCFAKSLGIQNQAQWSRQCASGPGQASMWRRSPNRRHRLAGYVYTDCAHELWLHANRDHPHVQSWDPLYALMRVILGRLLGGRDQYAPNMGIIVCGPTRELIRLSNNDKDHAEDGTPLENVSLWLEAGFTHLVCHIEGIHLRNSFHGITSQQRSVCAWRSRHSHGCSHSVGRWSPHRWLRWLGWAHQGSDEEDVPDS